MSAKRDKIFIVTYSETKTSPAIFRRVGVVGDKESAIIPTFKSGGNFRKDAAFLNNYYAETEFYEIGEEVEAYTTRDGEWRVAELEGVDVFNEFTSIFYVLRVRIEGDLYKIGDWHIRKIKIESSKQNFKLLPELESWFLGV